MAVKYGELLQSKFLSWKCKRRGLTFWWVIGWNNLWVLMNKEYSDAAQGRQLNKKWKQLNALWKTYNAHNAMC